MFRYNDILAKGLESASKKEEITVVAQKYQERLASIDQKVKQVQEDLAKEPVVSKHMYGSKISDLATLICVKHLDNPEFWVGVSNAHPEMFNWMAKLTQIAKDLTDDAT